MFIFNIYMSVRDRFIELLEEKYFSQARFCKVTGYTTNALTKFITGRTQYPKQDFFEAVKMAWPDVNLNWLIIGEEPKYIKKGLPELSDLPEKVNVEDLTRYNGPTYKDMEEPAGKYVTQEQFEKGMNKLSKVMEWYITKELLPKLREVDPEEADRAEEMLKDL